MDQNSRELVQAVLTACDGHPHPESRYLRIALTYGFTLTEENGEVKRYEPPTTAAEVKAILPKAVAHIEELKAMVAEAGSAGSGGTGSKFEDLPDGITPEIMEDMLHLMGTSTERPIRSGGFRELTEEEIAEIVRLSA